MKKFLLTTVAVAVLASPVMAADLAPVYKAPPPPPPGWTGFYIGGTVGGVFTNNSVDVTTTNVANDIQGNLTAFGLSTGPAVAAAATGSVPAGWSSLAGGFEAGYNWQFAPTWLLGLEADIQGIAGPFTTNAINQFVPRTVPGFGVDATIASTSKVDWLGTVRGRLGYLITPMWLIYGTGGLAYGDASSSTLITAAENKAGFPPFAFSPAAGAFSGTRIGWAAGVGTEYMFAPNWTAKVEWLHYDLGSVTYSSGTMVGSVLGAPEFVNVSSSTARFSGDIVRGGINYKF